ncbi:MAG: enoyl-CoA hydratase [Candidatus Competibacteraceae bacterium]|jgi:enoyl-CoA hydratase/carnithine racemase|nr:enoyl-CoA hydratase [Candidatus Competibacteraceae bacterium]
MTEDRLLMENWGRVLLLTLSDPTTRNALHPDIYRAGKAIFQQAAQDDGVGAIVLTGAQGVFCSGGNLGRLNRNRTEPSVQVESIALFHDWIREFRACPKPIIAAVEGDAAGAGFTLALACDLVVASEDTRFSMAYIKVGLSPDGGASFFLTRALTPQLAAEILFGGQPVLAPRLHQLGLINRLCAKGQALHEALRWAEILAAAPSFALAKNKALLNTARVNDFETQLEQERAAFLACFDHPQCGEGIAAFLKKRRADFVAKSGQK